MIFYFLLQLIHGLVDRIMEVTGTPYVSSGDNTGYYIERSHVSTFFCFTTGLQFWPVYWRMGRFGLCFHPKQIKYEVSAKINWWNGSEGIFNAYNLLINKRVRFVMKHLKGDHLSNILQNKLEKGSLLDPTQHVLTNTKKYPICFGTQLPNLLDLLVKL